jgi:uncharacterized protein
LATSTRQAISQGSDTVIVSGKLTGDAPLVTHLREVREAAEDFPVLVGSGANPDNISELFLYADGAIVGTALKDSMEADAEIQSQRVSKFMRAIHSSRSARVTGH